MIVLGYGLIGRLSYALWASTHLPLNVLIVFDLIQALLG